MTTSCAGWQRAPTTISPSPFRRCGCCRWSTGCSLLSHGIPNRARPERGLPAPPRGVPAVAALRGGRPTSLSPDAARDLSVPARSRECAGGKGLVHAWPFRARGRARPARRVRAGIGAVARRRRRTSRPPARHRQDRRAGSDSQKARPPLAGGMARHARPPRDRRPDRRAVRVLRGRRARDPPSPRALGRLRIPDGLAREAIPLEARIVAVVDVFDALTSARSYRPALDRDAACAMLRQEAGHTLDETVMAALLGVIELDDR